MSPSADRELKIKILGDSSGAQKAFKDVDSGSSSLAGSLGKLGGVLAATFAADKIIGFVTGGVEAIANMDRIVKQTESVVKSTGGAAGVTAQQVSEMANSIERATGIEAENIQTGQNMLLTFTNIKNGVGAGNDIFNQASKTMLDLATAMGGDTQGAAVQLGKALNDPQKGITALTKVGVTFTDQQKAQIKAMQDAGDTAGAQKVILAELNREFGGSADAFGDSSAGKIAKFKNEMGNLQEEIVGAFLPAGLEVVGFLTDKLPGAVDAVGSVAERVQGTINSVVNGLKGDKGGGITAALGLGGDESGQISGSLGRIRETLSGFTEDVRAKFEGIRAFVAEIMPQVQEAIGHVLNVVQELWRLFGDNILTQVHNVFSFISEIVSAGLQIIQGVIRTVLAVINGDWGKAWEGIKQILGGVWDAIFGILRFALDTMTNLLSAGWDALKAVTLFAWNGLKSIISSAIEGVITFHRELPGRILGALGDLLGLLRSKGSDIIQGLRNGVDSAFGGLLELARSLPSKIREGVGDLTQLLKRAGEQAIEGLVNGIKGKFGDVKETLGDLTGKLTQWKGPPERDQTILRPAGRMVLGGFQQGLRDEFPAIKRELESMTTELGGVGSAGGGGSSSSKVVNIEINAPGAYAEPITEQGLANLLAATELLYA